MATKKTLVKKEQGVIYFEDKSYAVCQKAPAFDLQIQTKKYLKAFNNMEVVDEKFNMFMDKKHSILTSVDVDTDFDKMIVQVEQCDKMITHFENEQDKALLETNNMVDLLLGFLVPEFDLSVPTIDKIGVLKDAMAHNRHFVKNMNNGHAYLKTLKTKNKAELTAPITN